MDHDDRIGELKQALLNLAGADDSLTGRFARFRKREQVVMIPFSSDVAQPTAFDIEDADSMHAVSNFVQQLEPGGQTAIFDAVNEAYRYAENEQQAHPERLYSVVLMTDGSNTMGESEDAFANWYHQHSDTVANIRTFPVIFGNADDETMHQLAEMTGGRTFDSRHSNLSFVFKKIRGYQ